MQAAYIEAAQTEAKRSRKFGMQAAYTTTAKLEQNCPKKLMRFAAYFAESAGEWEINVHACFAGTARHIKSNE